MSEKNGFDEAHGHQGIARRSRTKTTGWEWGLL